MPGTRTISFFLFDLLLLDGADLTGLPLTARKPRRDPLID
jgi:ATP-dependent DNA ligase